MKTKEEGNDLQNEVEAMNTKLAELAENELKQVTGGNTLDNCTRDGHVAVVCAELQGVNVEPAVNRNARPS